MEQLGSLYTRGEAVLAAAERDGRAATAIAALKEMRGILLDIARLTGELDERPVTVVNLHQSQEWQTLQVAIIRALDPFPEARYAVAAAISRPELTA